MPPQTVGAQDLEKNVEAEPVAGSQDSVECKVESRTQRVSLQTVQTVIRETNPHPVRMWNPLQREE